MRPCVVVVLLATGCGRLGFGDGADAIRVDAIQGDAVQPDDAAVDAAPIDALTRISIRVASANDDAEEGSDGLMYLDSSDLELCDDTETPHLMQFVGMRFVGIPAPRGTRVVHARIQFTVDAAANAAAGMQLLRGGLLPAIPFTAADRDLSSRVLTTASSTWVPTLWTVPLESGPSQVTPELAPIVEEILARPEWIAGSAIAIFVTGTGTNQARSFEGSPTAAPLLELEYLP